MKKFVLGFIAGVMGMFVVIGNMTMEDLEKMTSEAHKKKFIDKIEYMLLGYNTHKTRIYKTRDFRGTYHTYYRPKYEDDYLD